jgi:hypothetical protein
MAIYNISYKNKEIEKLINEELGKAYSLYNKLKLGGIGSRRMIIEHLSERINHLKLKVSGIQYGNIEIRPNGIIVHINQGIYTYAWTIPYYHLNIYNGDYFTIHGAGNYIQFNKEKSWKENRKFLTKLIDLKAKFNSVK